MIQFELINGDALKAPDPELIQSWLTELANRLDEHGEVCIKIVDAAESQQLNATYRRKDKPTNVLSFPSDVPDFVESEHLGDLAICAEVVETEAAEQGKELMHHWAHMVIHGVLHLLGYDHIEEHEAVEMESLEIQLLGSMGMPNPYV